MVTGRAHEVLEFVREYKEEKGMAPTHREIMEACGISSTSQVSHWLNKLQVAGLILWRKRVARGIVLVKEAVKPFEDQASIINYQLVMSKDEIS